MVITLVLIVGILIFISSFLCFLYNDSELQKHRDLEITGEAQRIKFKTFVAMYEMNPDHWRCENFACQYRPTATEYFYFSFGIIDYFRWKSFLFDLEAKKLQKADCEKTAKYLEYFKKDIAAYEEKHKKETEEKLKEIWAENEKYVVVKDENGELRIVKNRYWNSK